jgi:hypothetical protein
MATATGTASGYLDLLDRLVTFATGLSSPEAWTVDRNITAADGERELIMHGPGLAGDDAVYVGIRGVTNSTSDYYNWRLMGCTGFVSGNDWTAQPNVSPVSITDGNHLLLWDDAIPYTFIGSGRRLIVVAKVSTVYETAYLGLALPYATPGQYPYPLVVGGTCRTGDVRWSNQSTNHSAFWRPQAGGLSWRTQDGNWLRLVSPTTSSLSQITAGGTRETLWREAPDGTRWLLPLVGTQYNPNNTLGELDGVAAVPGFGVASEDTVDDGTDDWLVVQSGWRTTSTDYAAVRLL